MRLLRPALGVGVGTLVLAAGIGTATAGDPAQPRVQLAPAAVTSPPGGQPPTGGSGASGPDGARPFMLEIDGRPAAQAAQLTRRSTGSSTQAARSGRRQRATNVAAQAAAMQTAERRGLVERELYRVRTAYNGVAVMARPADVDRLRRIPGVRAVTPIPLHERQNGRSVPATGAPEAWKAAAGGNVGQGLRVGVLDSGIDYVHATFAGSGDADDLAAARAPRNNPRASGPVPGFRATNDAGDVLYPNAVVAGGVDLVGDDYDGRQPETAIPRPDPNPLDCPAELGGGHGTHVAGTVGGRGVNADGSTYADGYDSVPDDLRIGPGVAPGVELYAIRVFGCEGTTAFIARGIDWAVDPNQDGDPSDHLDVLNISAGSGFGDGDGPEVAAAQTASRLGVAVVISAGNNGNLTNTVGSPGVTPAALTVANFSSGDWLDQVTVSGAAPGSEADGQHRVRASAAYPWSEMSSDVSGTLVRAPAENRDGCGAYAESLAGEVVLVDVRTAPGAPMGCPSSVVADHATDAGAVGVVMADVNGDYGAQMGGNEETPLVHVVAPVRARLLAALAGGATPTVTFSPTLIAQDYDPASADTVDESTSRGPAASGGLKPEIAAPGQSIKSARSGSGSGFSVMGGTSMAAPHVSGAMALLRKHRSTWTVEELKAALVNTARPEIHTQPGHGGRRESPARVGSGAMDVAAALKTTTVAYAADADGAVALGFGPLQVPVGAPYRVERTVRVANKSLQPATYAVSMEPVTNVPGVAWELPDGDAVTVAPGTIAELRVRLVVVDPTQLRNARDETLPETFDDDGEVLRQRWLAEATGLLRLVAPGRALTVPVHAAVRPAAATTTSPVELAPGATSGALRFSGPTFDSGRTSADFLATRIALEWQASSPRLPASGGTQPPASADIEHVGVTVRDGQLTFGITTWGENPAPGLSGTVNVVIDTDGDGEADVRLHELRPPGSDAFLTCAIASDEPEGPAECTTSLLNRLTEEPGVYGSRLSLLSAPLEMLGIDGPFAYQVMTTNHHAAGVVDDVGPLSFDPAHPALRFDVGATAGGGDAGLEADVAGPLAFGIDRARAAATGTGGALVLHPLGAAAQQAETIAIGEAAPRPVDPPAEPPVDAPRELVPPPLPPPFVPHDLRLPAPPQARLPKHRRTTNVAGARLTITGPRRCVKPTGTFTVELSARRRSRDARFSRIVRSELRVDGKRASADRKAPFRHRVRVVRLERGSLHRVTARASLRLRDGKVMRKSIDVRFRVCG